MIGVAALLVLAGVGYYVLKVAMAPPPPPPIKAHPVAKAPKPGAPGDPLHSAIVNAQRNEQSRVDTMANGNFSTGNRAPAAAPPANASKATAAKLVPPSAGPVEVTGKSRTSIAPGITATTNTMMTAAEASQPFRDFVAVAQINGVFQGNPARALINGRTFQEGDMVSPSLGIVFDHVEPGAKLIVFRDRTGATVERKY
ncbi:MAG: hypothetical protein ACHQ4G_05710 [Opitutales bacterium]